MSVVEDTLEVAIEAAEKALQKVRVAHGRGHRAYSQVDAAIGMLNNARRQVRVSPGRSSVTDVGAP